MGIFASLKGIGASLMADADKALSRMSDKPTFQRTVFASYLVAAASGGVSDAEKVTMGRVIAKKLPSFKAGEVAKAIDDAAEECALSQVAGKIALMSEISKASGTEQARVIMLGVLAVANADNEFDDAEMKVAKEICTSLGLRTQEYGF